MSSRAVDQSINQPSRRRGVLPALLSDYLLHLFRSKTGQSAAQSSLSQAFVGSSQLVDFPLYAIGLNHESSRRPVHHQFTTRGPSQDCLSFYHFKPRLIPGPGDSTPNSSGLPRDPSRPISCSAVTGLPACQLLIRSRIDLSPYQASRTSTAARLNTCETGPRPLVAHHLVLLVTSYQSQSPNTTVRLVLLVPAAGAARRMKH